MSPAEYHHAVFASLGIDGGRIRDDEPDGPDDDPHICRWGCAELEAKFVAVNARNHLLEAKFAAVSERNHLLEAEIASFRKERLKNLFTESDDDL